MSKLSQAKEVNDAVDVLELILSLVPRFECGLVDTIESCSELSRERVKHAVEYLVRQGFVEVTSARMLRVRLVDKKLKALVYGIDRWGHINTEIVCLGERTYRNPYYAQLMRQNAESK